MSLGGPKWKNHHVKLESTEMRMVIWDLLKALIHLNHVLFTFFFLSTRHVLKVICMQINIKIIMQWFIIQWITQNGYNSIDYLEWLY